jgi:hypothetical protein
MALRHIMSISHSSSYRQRALQYQDHVTTLQDYLADYQDMERKVMEDKGVDVLTPEIKEVVSERRIDAFDAYACHILLTCSPKMRSWDKHSMSQEVLPLPLLDHGGKAEARLVDERDHH